MAPGAHPRSSSRRPRAASSGPRQSADFSVRLPEHWTGVEGKIADTFNEVVSRNRRMAGELARVSRVVGKEGKIEQRTTLGDVEGKWAESVESVNALIEDLSYPTRE